MKNRILAISLICVFAICGCGKKDDTVTISQDEFDELMKRATEAQSNAEAAEALKDLEDATGADIPIEELTGVGEKDIEDEGDHGSLAAYFPYDVSDEIKNSNIMDGKIQIYKDVFDLNNTMTPQDVYDVLMKSDRKDLFDVQIKNDEEGITCGLIVDHIGWVRTKDAAGFIFDRFDRKGKIVFDDETVEVPFKSQDNQYYLVGLEDDNPIYYHSDQDSVESPDILYSGGISNRAHKLDGSKWTNEELIKALEDMGYVMKPEGITRDDSIMNSKGMYWFAMRADLKNDIIAVKHIPEFDSYDFTYTKDKVEYIEYFTGLCTEFKFLEHPSIWPKGLGGFQIIYRGKEAIEKIEFRLKELGLESKINQEINDAHIND